MSEVQLLALMEAGEQVVLVDTVVVELDTGEQEEEEEDTAEEVVPEDLQTGVPVAEAVLTVLRLSKLIRQGLTLEMA